MNLVTITYDADGDTTQVKDANTNYQYTYNADDEVSTFADNGTTGLPLVTLTYGYDGDGNETSVADSEGGLLTLTYDAPRRTDQRAILWHGPFGRGRDLHVNEMLSHTTCLPYYLPAPEKRLAAIFRGRLLGFNLRLSF